MRGQHSLLLGLVVAVTVVAPASAAARAGDVDPSFGIGGEVSQTPLEEPLATTAWADPVDFINTRDGGLVIAGYVINNGGLLQRLTADGSPDPRFGTGGTVRVAAQVSQVAEQADGKLVVAAGEHRGPGPGSEFVVMRLLRNGMPDPSFGENGTVRVPFDSNIAFALTIALMPDGRILAGGRVQAAFPLTDQRPPVGAALAMLLPDGRLDSSFGDRGRVVVPEDTLTFASELVVEPEGHFIVAGERPWGLTVIRFLPDGRIDRAYGDDGFADVPTVAVPGPTPMARAEDGALLVGGFSTDSSGLGFNVVRVKRDGRRDPSFATNGVATVQPDAGVMTLTALALQADGRIVATGGYSIAADEDNSVPALGWVLARFNRDGGPDRAFGRGGVVRFGTQPGERGRFSRYWGATGVVVQANGRIVVSGATTDCGRQAVTAIGFQGRPGASAGALPGAQLCGREEFVTDGGTAPVTVGCPMVVGICEGTITLRRAGSTVAKRRFAMNASHRRLRLMISRSTRRAVARRGRLATTAVVKTKVGRDTVASRALLTLRAPRRR